MQFLACKNRRTQFSKSILVIVLQDGYASPCLLEIVTACASKQKIKKRRKEWVKPYLHRSELGEKVVRNKYQPYNENPTSAGWDFCLQFSVQFSLRNWKLLTKLHSVKAP